MDSEYSGTLIVPMTIYDKNYLEEIVGKLKSINIEVKHFTLIASEEILIDRLNKRGDVNNEWVHSRVSKCVTAFKDDFFEGKINTEIYGIEEVVKLIAKEI